MVEGMAFESDVAMFKTWLHHLAAVWLWTILDLHVGSLDERQRKSAGRV